MKYPISLLIFFCFWENVLAQNLVPNPGFETMSQCPTGNSQINGYCSSWVNVGTGTSDYLNSCNTGSQVGVPVNFWGTQAAASGNGYVGVYTYAGANPYKEYVAATLASRLKPGGEYQVSWSQSLSDTSGYGTNDIGVQFTSGSTAGKTLEVLDSASSPVIDRQNWVRKTQNIVVDDDYVGIKVGGLLDNTTMKRTATGTFQNYSYYYIDDIDVRLVSNVYFYFPDTALCGGDTIKVGYGVSGGIYTAGNVFKLQLSNASGSFVNAIDIGVKTSISADTIIGVIPIGTVAGAGYRLRIVSTAPVTYAPYSHAIGIGSVIPQKPVANAPSIVCSADTIHLTATTATPGVNWFWQGTGNFVSHEQNPDVLITLLGQHYYYVTAYSYGCRSRDTVSVWVKQSPMPFTATSGSFCEKDTIRLTAGYTAINLTTFSWTGPAGYNDTGRFAKRFAASTTYGGLYTAVANLAGCTRQSSVSVVVRPIPVIVGTSNSPVCTGDTVKLDLLSVSQGATISRTGPNSYSSALATVSIPNATSVIAGKYITTAVLNACIGRDTTEVIVKPVPPTPVATSNSPVCVNGDILLSATTNSANANFEWGGPVVYYDTAKNPKRGPAQIIHTGKYHVRTFVEGCPSLRDTVSVQVVQGPKVLIYPNPGDSVCPHWKVNFAAVVQNGGANPAFEWYKNNQFTGSTGATFLAPTVATGDSFYVKLTAGTTCNTPIVSAPVRMTVLPVDPSPTIGISVEPNAHVWPYVQVSFKAKTSMAGPHPGYQWKRNGRDVSGAIDSTWNTTNLWNGDTICCVVTSGLLCANPREVLSNCIVMNIDLGLNKIASENGALNVYPNPTGGNFTVSGRADKDVHITVYDVTGKKVYTGTEYVQGNSFKHNVTMPEVAAGIYRVVVTTDADIIGNVTLRVGR